MDITCTWIPHAHAHTHGYHMHMDITHTYTRISHAMTTPFPNSSSMNTKSFKAFLSSLGSGSRSSPPEAFHGRASDHGQIAQSWLRGVELYFAAETTLCYRPSTCHSQFGAVNPPQGCENPRLVKHCECAIHASPESQGIR